MDIAVWRFRLAGCALAAVLITSPAQAEPYVDLLGGVSAWPDRSNGHETEADAQPAPVGTIALGYQWDWLAADISASYLLHKTHGRNPNGEKQDENGFHFTGDEPAHVVAGLVNLWPGVQVGRWRVYAGGGAGIGLAKVFGEWDMAPAVQAGGGVVFDITERLSAHAGVRALWLGRTEHKGLEAGFNSYGVLAGVRLRL